MNDFEYLNVFYNMIYGNEPSFFRGALDSYEHFNGYRQWAKSKDIDLGLFMDMSEEQFILSRACSSVETMSHLLHMDLLKQINQLKQIYENKTHIIFFPGVNQDPWNSFVFNRENTLFYQIETRVEESKLVISDPFPGLLEAILNIDKWPGALIFTKDKAEFFPMRNRSDIDKLNKHLDDTYLYQCNKTHNSYYLHISDVHLGSEKKEKALMSFYDSLNQLIPYLHSDHKLKMVITGDLMNSPSKKNMYRANDFMVYLKKKYHMDVTFILGNHDMIVHGVNIGGRQKSKVIAYLLGEKLKVLEDDKVILIKMDSNSQGSLARGAIGQRQLLEIEDELSTIDNLEEYTLVALLHHHLIKIQKADFLKVSFKEKALFGKLLDSSKALIDAEIVRAWINRHHIQYVLHGHKHVPFFINKNGTYVISAGSCTGGGLKEEKSRYISYNLLKYNYLTQKMNLCFIFYVDRLKTSRTKIEIYKMED